MEQVPTVNITNSYVDFMIIRQTFLYFDVKPVVKRSGCAYRGLIPINVFNTTP